MQGLERHYPAGIPQLDPEEDMLIEDPAALAAAKKLQGLLAQLHKLPLQQVRQQAHPPPSAGRHVLAWHVLLAHRIINALQLAVGLEALLPGKAQMHASWQEWGGCIWQSSLPTPLGS